MYFLLIGHMLISDFLFMVLSDFNYIIHKESKTIQFMILIITIMHHNNVLMGLLDCCIFGIAQDHFHNVWLLFKL